MSASGPSGPLVYILSSLVPALIVFGVVFAKNVASFQHKQINAHWCVVIVSFTLH